MEKEKKGWECEKNFTVKLKVTHRLYDAKLIKGLMEEKFKNLFITVEEITEEKQGEE